MGASVVNALSSKVVVTVKRDGAECKLEFKTGVPQGKLQKVGAARGSGTTVFFRPDPTIFPKIEFSAETIRERLEIMSFLHSGLRVHFVVEQSGEKYDFHHEGGLADYLTHFVGVTQRKSVHDAAFVMQKRRRQPHRGGACAGPSRLTSS
ncbi:MAG: hypothetical protein QM756_18075 [Polyangiaceae bacterium]